VTKGSGFTHPHALSAPNRNLRNLCNLRIILSHGPPRGTNDLSIKQPRIHANKNLTAATIRVPATYPVLFALIRVHSRLAYLRFRPTLPSEATSARRLLRRDLICANSVRIARPTSRTGGNGSTLSYGRVRVAAHKWRSPALQIISVR
jgi:hypothetical protein